MKQYYKKAIKVDHQGFTLVELMIALCISSVVLAGVFMLFNSQQKSYITQDGMSMTQQNLRAAMDMLKRDIQMAGFYTNCIATKVTMDYDDDGADETIRPLILAGNNVNDGGGADDILDNTDTIVIVKADEATVHTLSSAESAVVNTFTLTTCDLDGDGTDDFNFNNNVPGRIYGLLVTRDLSGAEIFTAQNTGPYSVQPLTDVYSQNDRIARLDIIIYKVDDNRTLVRRNLGDDNGFMEIAENIDDLQFRYMDQNGNWESDPANPANAANFINGEADVRAVEVSVLARSARTDAAYVDAHTYNIGGATVTPNDSFRRKVLSCRVLTRNIGL